MAGDWDDFDVSEPEETPEEEVLEEAEEFRPPKRRGRHAKLTEAEQEAREEKLRTVHKPDAELNVERPTDGTIHTRPSAGGRYTLDAQGNRIRVEEPTKYED